jgi:hypothetical protein
MMKHLPRIDATKSPTLSLDLFRRNFAAVRRVITPIGLFLILLPSVAFPQEVAELSSERPGDLSDGLQCSQLSVQETSAPSTVPKVGGLDDVGNVASFREFAEWTSPRELLGQETGSGFVLDPALPEVRFPEVVVDDGGTASPPPSSNTQTANQSSRQGFRDCVSRSVTTGLLAGAGVGAVAGAFAGGIGTLPGAGVGLVVGAVSSFFTSLVTCRGA